MRTALFSVLAMLAWLLDAGPVSAAAVFQDGLLGLTQPELRAKLGPPHKVRTRMAAQRVYNYHSLDSWENVLKDQMSGTMAEDVYVFIREGVKVRYSFQYTEEYKPTGDIPNLLVSLVDVEFMSPDAPEALNVPVAAPFPVPLSNLMQLVPEFKPATSEEAPTFRSNLFIILIQEPPSPAARSLIKVRAKDDYDWSLAYRLYNSEGFPPRIRLSDTITRMEFSIDSPAFIRDHQKITHERLLNPYSEKAISLPPPPEPAKKGIPKPRYAP
ncbi:MAG TPA: hypothetical protein VGJ57_09875 [Nitrospirales bacterium]